jgi:GT2 family glycosyltransferase
MVDNEENFFVTAVLVTHDGALWLPQVIAALSAQTRRIDRLIAVDTGSGDSSVKLLRAAGITVVEAERDHGYGDAIEIALEHAPSSPSLEESSAEWIWLIHDDCAPARDALEIMLHELVDRPQVVIAGPKLLGWYDRDHLLEAGVSIAINGARWTGLENREQDQGQQNFTREVLSVSTAAMLVRRSAFVELGGLDPNLALFRDDVDLGWRAHVAGFGAICVGAATVYHAQASASERRIVDVSEAFLHRPLLLDRRNAAYVLLVNSTWWMLPWVSFQLLGTSIARAIFDLFAKLPGYAGDEIAAIGLLLLHPGELISARRARRKKRLLSPAVVKRFIPPRGSQIRAGIDRVRSVLLKSVEANRAHSEWESEQTAAPSFTDFGILEDVDDEFESLELSAPIQSSFLRNFFRRPDILTLLAFTFCSLMAARARFGQLSGGALSLVPSSGLNLFRSYIAAWHPVGMGSNASEPVWILILSLASILTLGHLSLLVTALFILTPPLAFYIFMRTLLRTGVAKNFAILGGAIYALDPLLWTSLNQGRIATIILVLLLPSLLLVQPFVSDISSYSWRRVFAIALLASLISAFSPLLFLIWLIGQFILLTLGLVNQRATLRGLPFFDLLESSHFRPVVLRLVLLVAPFLLLAPWSFTLLVHPTQWLLAPGVPINSGGIGSQLLLNPGGLGSTPLWLISPLFIALVSMAALSTLSRRTSIVSVLYGAILVLSSLHVAGHGSIANVWSGDLLTLLAICVLPPLLKQAEEFIPSLRTSTFGIKHISIGLVSALLSVSALGTIAWIVTSPSRTLVRANQAAVVPAFVGALAATPDRPKTLVVAVGPSSTSYYVTRGDELSLGDADVSTSIPLAIQTAMNQVVTGSGLAASQTLGDFGIDYLFIQSPVPVALASVIDGIGGFSRLSTTPSGTMWKILNSHPRVAFSPATGAVVKIQSQTSGAAGFIPSSGRVLLGEKYDSNWRLLQNGQPVALSQSSIGLPYFAVNGSGKILLTYDGTLHRALLSLEFLVLIFSVVMALPSGRRRGEVPLEELV